MRFMSSQIRYVVPARQDIAHYARQLCAGLSISMDAQEVMQPEIVNGLAEFIHVLLTIEANQLNAASADTCKQAAS